MCRAWENSINNAKNEGMREGIREGELKGKIETLYEECDMSIPDIAKKVSKPEEYVKEVIEKMSAACLQKRQIIFSQNYIYDTITNDYSIV